MTVDRLMEHLSLSGVEFSEYERRAGEGVEIAKSLSVDDQVTFVMKALPLLSHTSMISPRDLVAKPVSAVLRKKLPFTPEQIVQLVEFGADPSYYFPFASVLRLAES